MSPRIRTAIALVIAVVICSYQLLDVGGGRFAAAWWPWLALLIVAATLAMNARALQRAGIAIGFGGERQLPTAGLNFSAAVTLLTIIGTLIHRGWS